MLATRRYARVLCGLAAYGILASPVLGVELTSLTTQKIFDVALTENNHLVGQVVTAEGKSVPQARVRVTQAKSAFAAETRTDEAGGFQFALLRSGTYRVSVDERSFTIRAWQTSVAPPSAKSGLLCVTGDTVRGQHRHPRLVSFLTNPITIGLTIAAAIAIPVAIDDDDDQGDGASGGSGEPAS